MVGKKESEMSDNVRIVTGEFHIDAGSGVISISKVRRDGSVASSVMISECEGDLLVTTYASRHHATLDVDNNGPAIRIRDEDVKSTS